MAKSGIRRDSKHRVLRRGESIRWDGKYQFKYHVNGKAHFVYSWRLEPTDKLPAGKKPCLSLRELEKQIGYDLDSQMHPEGRSMTVEELVERYLSTRIGVKPNTKSNYNFVKNLMKKEDFYYKKIGDVKTSDAKLFLIKLQQDGKRYSTVKTVRGVLRPTFQMAVDDDVLREIKCESFLNLFMMIMYTASIMKLCIYFFIQVCAFRNFVALQLKMLI